MALVLTFLFITFKELFSRKILFRKEIEDYSYVPVVGEISNFKNSKDLLPDSNNRLMAEQLLQLRVATGLLPPQNTNRKILITSSIAGEGKTIVSSNLALSLSQSGKKVILLEADIRDPHLSHLFLRETSSGIAEYLEGDISPADIINSTSYSNLFVAGAGRTRMSSTELLLNGRIKGLFEYLENTFEYIIVDASPINMVTDAYVWSEYCDLTLFVVRHQFTPKSFIRSLDYNNKARSLKNMAIVFNGIKRRGFIKNDYGYGYGYETVLSNKMMAKRHTVAG